MDGKLLSSQEPDLEIAGLLPRTMTIQITTDECAIVIIDETHHRGERWYILNLWKSKPSPAQV